MARMLRHRADDGGMKVTASRLAPALLRNHAIIVESIYTSSLAHHRPFHSILLSLICSVLIVSTKYLDTSLEPSKCLLSQTLSLRCGHFAHPEDPSIYQFRLQAPPAPHLEIRKRQRRTLAEESRITGLIRNAHTQLRRSELSHSTLRLPASTRPSLSVSCLETQSDLLSMSVNVGMTSHEYQHKKPSTMRHRHVLRVPQRNRFWRHEATVRWLASVLWRLSSEGPSFEPIGRC
jgi:hypothetical protein